MIRTCRLVQGFRVSYTVDGEHGLTRLWEAAVAKETSQDRADFGSDYGSCVWTARQGIVSPAC